VVPDKTIGDSSLHQLPNKSNVIKTCYDDLKFPIKHACYQSSSEINLSNPPQVPRTIVCLNQSNCRIRAPVLVPTIRRARRSYPTCRTTPQTCVGLCSIQGVFCSIPTIKDLDCVADPGMLRNHLERPGGASGAHQDVLAYARARRLRWWGIWKEGIGCGDDA